MTPAMQQAIALVIVLGAASYVARRAWSKWRAWRAAGTGRGGCGPDCGCGPA